LGYPETRKNWRERAAALRNIPPVLKLLWRSGPAVVGGELAARVLTALVPVATFWVAKTIIDMVMAKVKNPSSPFPHSIWYWLAAEFTLAASGNILGRAIGYFDTRIADNFSAEVSLRIMEHSAKLDLASFEDPVFYDKLERARVQATDRINMLNAIGNLIQQFVTLTSLAIALIWYNPLLFLFLVVCVVPSFLGESVPGLFAGLPAHAAAPGTRLSAGAGHQQRIGQGDEDLRPRALAAGALQHADRPADR
jgi:ATP-binding cassette subfamily B protein